MDKFPVRMNGKIVGEMTTEREKLYTWFDLHCAGMNQEIWCAWAVGERGELRVGVLEPQGGELVIRRRFSDQMTSSLGRLLYGEIRPVKEAEQECWKPLQVPETVIHTAWLRRGLQGRASVLYRRDGKRLLLTISYEPNQPFPLLPLFCFAKLEIISGRLFLQFAFDETERPLFQ